MRPDPSGKKILILAFILALTLRALFVISTPLKPYIDEICYDTTAQNIIQGRGYSSSLSGILDSNRPPLFPFLLAGIYGIFGPSHLAAKLALALIGSLTCLFIYLIAKEVFNKRVATVALLISIVYPFFIYYTGRLLTETLFVFLLATTILELIKVTKTHFLKDQLLVGGLLGLAILTRPVLSFFPIAILILLFVLFENKKIALKNFAIIFLVMVVILAPWTIRNYKIHHNFVLVSTIGGLAFWGGNNPQAVDGGWFDVITPEEFKNLSEVEQSKRFYQMGFSFIRENPKLGAKRAFLKVGRFWSLYPRTTKRDKIISLFSYGLLLPFSILGAFLSLKRWRKVLVLYLTILYFTGMSVIFYGSTRFRLPIEPYIIIFGGAGLNYLIEKIKKRSTFEYRTENP